MRDAEESDQAVIERGGGRERSDGDACAIVLDAVERRRGNEVEVARSDERSGFRGGGAHRGKRK